MWLKSMIERCIAQFRQGACATCDRKDVCVAAKWQQTFAFAGHSPARESPPKPEASVANPLMAFLGAVADSIGAAQKPRRKSFRKEVEERLRPLLASGDVGIDRVAAAMGYSRQTLYRRLKAEGVTYEQLLDDLRRKLALRYIRDDGMGVKQTAYLLGFSDPAAFSRAFKRWTGHSPSEMRP